MLLQSQGGLVRIFPAIPAAWNELSFKDLRAEGAFLVSAEQGKSVEVSTVKGGLLKIELPPGDWIFQGKNGERNGNIWQVRMQKGGIVKWLMTK